MHLFFRTVGFSEFSTKDEEKLIKAAVKSAVAAGSVVYNKELQRGMIQMRTGEKTGLCIYGQYDGKKFKKEYYYPYLLGGPSCESDEITIERHTDKESYAAVCEEIKAGVTLIFYLQNIMDYLAFMVPEVKSSIRSKAQGNEIDNKSGNEPIDNKPAIEPIDNKLAIEPIDNKPAIEPADNKLGNVQLDTRATMEHAQRSYAESRNSDKAYAKNMDVKSGNPEIDNEYSRNEYNNKADNIKFNLLTRNVAEKQPIQGRPTTLSALSVGGMILLPISKNKKQIKKNKDAANARKDLLAAARDGDEDAIESLTIEDLDTYTKLSKRITYEDVFTIVDSSFMPCGIECDQYSIVGEIQEIKIERNVITGEEIHIMTLECNDLLFDIAINSYDLVGEPAVGRRFKGQIWLQGAINF